MALLSSSMFSHGLLLSLLETAYQDRRASALSQYSQSHLPRGLMAARERNLGVSPVDSQAPKGTTVSSLHSSIPRANV